MQNIVKLEYPLNKKVSAESPATQKLIDLGSLMRNYSNQVAWKSQILKKH